jgi:translation initiation factor 2 alpha subunit (eIF-2alpha)
MSWEPYALDCRARKLVKNQSEHSQKEAYKMREAVAYGLERFWGESMRYRANQTRFEEQKRSDKALIEKAKADYWEDVWNELVEIIKEDIKLPKHKDVKVDEDELWKLPRDSQEVALAVLIQLCDCLVWWTQRYK